MTAVLLLVGLLSSPAMAAEEDEWLTVLRDKLDGIAPGSLQEAKVPGTAVCILRDGTVAWSVDLVEVHGAKAPYYGFTTSPLLMDGVLVVQGGAKDATVTGFDPESGELLWRHDPKVPRNHAASICCDVVNRGVAFWQGAVFVGTLDGRLISLDARTGVPRWSVQTTDQARPYAITGAPRVVRGNVIIGNGGADLGVRGYVSAYSAADGALRWLSHSAMRRCVIM